MWVPPTSKTRMWRGDALPGAVRRAGIPALSTQRRPWVHRGDPYGPSQKGWPAAPPYGYNAAAEETELKPSLILVALVMAVASGGAARADPDISKVMGSIAVAAGQHAGSVSTVNGSIRIGDNAVVGKCDTVNGSIRLDSHASAVSLETVNGSVKVAADARVTSTVATVNGSLSVADGADVGAALSNVNGSIRIGAAHIGGSIETTNADIDVGPNAHIDGGIHMNSDTSWWHFFFPGSPPRVVIAPGSVVRGPLSFERAVKLYVSDHASIGPVTGATAIRFAGANPPG
jgi:hypothetical protein